jgi:hypothetical protein
MLQEVCRYCLPQHLQPNSLYGSTDLLSLDLLLNLEVSRSHSDTPYSVGLHRTSDRSVPETSIRQHTAHSIHSHGQIRTRNLSKRAAADSTPKNSRTPGMVTYIVWRLVQKGFLRMLMSDGRTMQDPQRFSNITKYRS